jgi:hypothetical protein
MGEEERIIFKSENLPTFTERGFQPILKTFCNVLEKQDLEPLNTIQGKSIGTLREGFEKPFFKGFFKPFTMEKVEKLCLTGFIIMDRILLAAVVAIPHDDYELPMLIMEWSETEENMALVADFVPMADLVMRADYQEKYLDPLDTYWSKYKTLPGMEYNRFAWARQMLGPYYLAGCVPKKDEQNIKACMDLFQNYIEVWIDILQKADPVEDDQVKKYIKERKTIILKNFREKDEGAKALEKLAGKELQELTAYSLF